METATILIPLSMSTVEQLLELRERQDETLDQILQRLTRPKDDTQPEKAKGDWVLGSSPNRARDKYVLIVCGQRAEVGSIPEALRTAYLWLEELDAGFLERFSKVGGRRRRYVGSSIIDLHDDPDQARRFSFPIKDGWWGIGNCSLERARNTILWRACEIVGLRLGTDVDLIKRGEKTREPMTLEEFEALVLAANPGPEKVGRLAH